MDATSHNRTWINSAPESNKLHPRNSFSICRCERIPAPWLGLRKLRHALLAIVTLNEQID
jgi:hypothetical protein